MATNPYPTYQATKLIGMYWPRPDLITPTGPSKSAQITAPSSDLFDYNDPLAVNSLVDVLFNQAALNKHYADPNDVIGQLDTADISQMIIAGVDLVKRSTIDPITGRLKNATNPLEAVEGLAEGSGVALLNGLMNLGETLDIAANPIKGAILNPDNAQKGFLRGLGVTEEGRYNYDYNVDLGNPVVNFISNMALEVVTDPLNWISLGSTAVAKVGESVVKPVATTAIKEFGEQVSQEIAEKAAKEIATDTAEKIAKEGTSELLQATQEKLAKNLARNISRSPDDIVRAVTNTVRNTNMPAAYMLNSDRLIASLSKELGELTQDRLVFSLIDGLNKADTISNKVQSGLFKAVLASSGIVVPTDFLGKQASTLIGYAYNKINRALSPISFADGTIPIYRYDDARQSVSDALKYLSNFKEAPAGMSKELSEGVFLNLESVTYNEISDILKQYGKDPEQLLDVLNQRYLIKTQGTHTFETYVDSVEQYVQTHPNAQRVARDLINIRDTVRNMKNISEAIPEAKLIEKAAVRKQGNVFKRSKEVVNYLLAKYGNGFDPLASENTSKVFQRFGTSLYDSQLFHKSTTDINGVKGTAFKDVLNLFPQAYEKYKAYAHSVDSVIATHNLTPGFGDSLLENVLTDLSAVEQAIQNRTVNFKMFFDLEDSIDAFNRHNIDLFKRPDVLTESEYQQRLRGIFANSNKTTEGPFQIHEFDNLFEALHKRADAVLPEEVVQLSDVEDFAVHVLKLSQAYNNVRLISAYNEYLEQLFTDVLNKKGLPSYLRAMNDPIFDELANKLEVVVQGQLNYTELLYSWIKNPELEAIFPRLFDSLHTYSRVDLMKVETANSKTGNYFVEKIISDTDTQMLVLANRDKIYKLDHIYSDKDRYEKFITWVKTNYPNVDISNARMHDAVTDTLAVAYLFQDEELLGLPEYVSRIQEDYVNVFCDIETTGEKELSEQIVQISAVVDGETYNWKAQANPNSTPSVFLMKKLMGTQDEAEAIQLWNAEYGSADLPSEEQIVREFGELLARKSSESRKRVRLIGHNVDGFDKKFLLRRAIENMPSDPISGVIYNTATLDTLKLLRAKDGVPTLTDTQRDLIRVTLNNYISRRTVELFARDTPRKLIDNIDGSFSESLSMALRTVDDSLKDPTSPLNKLSGNWGYPVEMLKNIRTDVLETLTNIKRANKTLSEEFVFIDPLKKTFYDKYGRPISINGVMNTTQLFGEDVNAYMTYATKKVFQKSLYERFFSSSLNDVKYKKGQFIFDQVNRPEEKVFAQYVREFKIAQALDRMGQRIKNLRGFKNNKEPLEALCKSLNDYIVTLYKRNNLTYTLNLKLTSETLVDQVALSIYLYRTAKNYSKEFSDSVKFNSVLYALAEQDPRITAVLRTLEDGKFFQADNIYNGLAFSDPEQQTKKFFELYESEDLANTRTLNTEMKTIREVSEDLLHDASLVRKNSGFVGADAQAEYSILEDLINFDTDMRNSISKYIEIHSHDLAGFQDEIATGISDTGLITKPVDDPNLFLKMDIKRELENYTDNVALSELHDLARLSSTNIAQFKRHLFTDAHGIITFKISSRKSSVFFNEYTFREDLQNTFKNELFKNEEALLAAGIHLHYDDFTQRVFIILDKKEFSTCLAEEQALRVNRAYRDIAWPMRRALEPIQDYHRDYSDIISVVRSTEAYMHKLSRGHSFGSLGDTISYDNLVKLYSEVPADMTKFVIDPARFCADAKHFEYIRYNRSNIGVIASRKEFMPMISRNPFKNYAANIQSLVRRMDARMKFKYLFFNEDNALKGPFFDGFTDKELYDMIKAHPEYKLAGLKGHPKYGSVVVEYHVNSLRDIAELRKDPSVTVLPVQTFLMAWRKINDFKIGNRATDLLKKFIVTPTKTGYLMTTGWIMRNLVDSYTKNVMLTKDFANAGDMLWHTIQTFNTYRKYKEALMGIYSAAQEEYGIESTQIFSRAIAEKYLKDNTDFSPEEFFAIHDFIEQGPSAGLSVEQANILKARKELRTGEKEAYNILYDNKYTRFIMDTNSEVEQIMRLSGYTWAINRGDTVDEAMQQVMKYHFDYTARTPAMLYAEYVIPFLSFTVKNTVFWFDAIDTVPWLGSIFRDVMTPIWNFDAYSNYELNDNRSLQYQILAGNIVDEDTNLVIKLNPSVMDAISLLTDPTNWYERIIPVARVPLEILAAHATFDPNADSYEPEQTKYLRMVLENIPFAGPTIQRYWGSDLESIFTGNAEAPKGDDYRYRGSVQKGLERVTNLAQLTAFAPSIFGGVQRNYYFAYGEGDVYMTHSPEKLKENLEKGAIEIYAQDDLRVVNAMHRWNTNPKKPVKLYTPYTRKFNAKKTYPKTVRTKRTYYKKYYPPKRYDTTVQARIKASVRNSQFRMPGSFRNNTNPAPTIYRRLYTAKGTTRFKQRMVPVTAANLSAKLRSDWYFLRG